MPLCTRVARNVTRNWSDLTLNWCGKPGVEDTFGRTLHTSWCRLAMHIRRSMVTWCRSAVNRTRLSRLAVSRMRPSARDTLSQLCVWHVLPRTALPLAPPLPSIASAAASAALFDDFAGTMDESDFLWPCIIGLRVRPFRCGPPGSDSPRWPASGYPGSLAGGFHACARSWTTQGWAGARHDAPSHVAFRFSPQRRRPGPSTFRGSILCPHVPLSTLRCRPRGRHRMTRRPS